MKHGKEQLHIYDLREELGLLMPRPKPEEAKQWAEGYYNDYKKYVIDPIPNEKEAIVKELKQVPQVLQKLFPRDIVTSTTITASVLLAQWNRTQELAFQAINQVDIRNAIIFTDIAYGQEQVIAAIVRAEMVRVGDAHRTAVDTLFSNRKPKGNEAGGVQKLMRRYKNYALLLDKDHDPTGFLLVDEIVKNLSGQFSQIEGEPFISSYQIPEFVIAGAKMARDHYKALYSLVIEAVPPKK